MKKENSITNNKMQDRKFGKKKTIAVITVIAGLATVGIIVGLNMQKQTVQAKEKISVEQGEEVTTRSLVKSVGATGTIVGVKKKDLTVNLSNIDIEEINVKVGDIVTEGQELLVFDTSDIEEKLADAKTTLAKAQQKNSISEEESNRSVADAQRTKEYQIDAAKTNENTAYETYCNSLNDYNDAQKKVDDLKGQENSANDGLNNANNAVSQAAAIVETSKEEMDSKKAALDMAQVDLENTKNDITDENGELLDAPGETNAAGTEITQEMLDAYSLALTSCESAQTDFDTAVAANTTAQANYNSATASQSAAQTEYNAAKTKREQQESSSTTLNKQVSTSLTSYNTAQKNYDNTVAAQESTVQGALNSKDTSNLNHSTINEKSQVEQYQDQLEEGIVKAPLSGMITAVNYDPGDTYMNGTLITIQDCSSYEVEAQIGEYDISNVKEGQRVLIKTDATGDEELKGTVNFVSPIATKTMNSTTDTTAISSNKDITYKVLISVDTVNEKLRLDMSASLSIVIEKHDKALTVPYNAIQSDEDGNSFVEVIGEDDATVTKVPVKVVMESNYYTEIEKEALKEHQIVRVINTSDAATEEDSGEDFSMMHTEGGGF